MKRYAVALALLLTACGGGGSYSPEEEALELLDRQRLIYLERDHAGPAQVAEWERNWPRILALMPRPDYCESTDHELQARCVLEWQTLTHPWVWAR